MRNRVNARATVSEKPQRLLRRTREKEREKKISQLCKCILQPKRNKQKIYREKKLYIRPTNHTFPFLNCRIHRFSAVALLYIILVTIY